MRQCGWRHFAEFLLDKHDLRALLLQLAVLHNIYALAGNKEGPIRKIEHRGGGQALRSPQRSWNSVPSASIQVVLN
jgi:hypothetical protein